MGQKSNVISLRKNVEKVFLINTRTSDLLSKSLVFFAIGFLYLSIK